MTSRDQIDVARRAAEAGYFGPIGRGWGTNADPLRRVSELIAKLDTLLDERAKPGAIRRMLAIVIYDANPTEDCMAYTFARNLGRIE